MEFKYLAKSVDGQTLHGIRNSSSEAEMLSWVRSNSWIPIDIAPVLFSRDTFKFSAKEFLTSLASHFKLSLREKVVFFRQFATMISAGVSVGTTVNLLADQTKNKFLKSMAEDIYARICSGSSLSEALSEQSASFGMLPAMLAKAGEESGKLADAMQRTALFFEDQEKLREKVITAMAYPLTVIFIACAAFGVMLTLVVPQFERAFRELGVTMPELTRITLKTGDLIRSNFHLIALFFIVIAVSFYCMKRVDKTRLIIDRLSLRIPIIGDVIYKAALARAFKTAASLLQSGLPIAQTLVISGETAMNYSVRDAFFQTKDAVCMGIPMSKIIREKKLFPHIVANMIAVGEESGKTDEMMRTLAKWYESELTEKIKRLTSILEPVMVLVVGLVVALMAFAIFLPIMSAINKFI